MKYLFLIILSLPIVSYSHSFHSETVCSDESKSDCAHVGYSKEFQTNSPTEFVFHITTAGADSINSIQLYLWMEESNLGLFSAKVEKIGPGVFLVSDFEFPINGNWEIRAEFDHLLFHQIAIPIVVK